MKKTLSFGKVAYSGINRVNEVTVEIKLTDEDRPVFTVSADMWFANHNGTYMSGQCLDTIWEKFGTQINSPNLYKKILGLWKRNHLNNMSVRCEHQRQGDGRNNTPCSTCGYHYGSAWLYRSINEEDLQAIKEILQ